MPTHRQVSPELKERPVWLVREHRSEYATEWAAMTSVAEKSGSSTEALRRWVRQTETDVGERPGPTTDDRARLAQLERENRELRRANEILRTASAYFAQTRQLPPLGYSA
jgi:transposase-like protein